MLYGTAVTKPVMADSMASSSGVTQAAKPLETWWYAWTKQPSSGRNDLYHASLSDAKASTDPLGDARIGSGAGSSWAWIGPGQNKTQAEKK